MWLSYEVFVTCEGCEFVCVGLATASNEVKDRMGVGSG